MSSTSNRIVRGQIHDNEIVVCGQMGSGGQSTVYCGIVARGVSKGTAVAVKFIGEAALAERESEALREMRILATLDVVGVPRFVDFGTSEDGGTWLAMELVEGIDLRRFVRENGPFRHQGAEESLLAILHQLAQVLKELVSHEVMHRDLKPGNVIVNESMGRLWLVDFGLAKGEDDPQMTRHGAIKGTPAYLAPEAILGRAGAASDVYGAAAVIYYCATGRPPHQVVRDGNYWAVAQAVLKSRPQSLAKACPGIFSTRFSLLVSAAMHPDPEKRPTAAELVVQVEEILAENRS